MTSKRFKKKIKNFRQGMLAWRVHGYILSKNNAERWGTDAVYLDNLYGKGNYTLLSYGGKYILLCCDKVRNKNKPKKYTLNVHISGIMGAICKRYFSKPYQAQAFMGELKAGLHNNGIDALVDYHCKLKDLHYDYCYKKEKLIEIF